MRNRNKHQNETEKKSNVSHLFTPFAHKSEEQGGIKNTFDKHKDWVMMEKLNFCKVHFLNNENRNILARVKQQRYILLYD